MAKFIDLRCDFGFKFCMQDETVMKSFLNAILEGETERITSVKFENVEIPRTLKEERGVTFDLLCTTERGESILIEMQNSSQKFFQTRAHFYVYNLLRKQITRGFKWEEMEHDISRIFGIFILGERNNFLSKAVTRTSVYDRDELVEFWDRNHNFFISLPDFKWNKSDITVKDIWLYFFKNLGTMDRIDPSVYERADEGLLKLLEKANLAALTEDEYNLYEASMKALEDEIDMERHGYDRGFERGHKDGLAEGLKQGIERGIEQGIEQGKSEGISSMVTLLHQSGMSADEIASRLQMKTEQVSSILNNG